MTKPRAPRNRTIVLSAADHERLKQRLRTAQRRFELDEIRNRTICGDTFAVLDALPDACIDLLFADPPYNLDKTFNTLRTKAVDAETYSAWLDSWMAKLPRLMKPNGSLYFCGDWRSSASIQAVAERYFKVQNRIAWERDKGRGAKANWKNTCEDIWFCTMSRSWTFNVDDVKLRRRVIAPYTDSDGKPKDWQQSDAGNYRLTHPSNLWTDLTVPFWSMPENTDHPTQKPEKLLARIILASSNPKNVVFDPFLGCGTTSVAAKKLGRDYIGVEIDETYCLLAEHRLELAESDRTIQGYENGVFRERNS
ncbi:MAG: DNA-methyltransferase [Lentisphaeria bacterium]